MVVPSSRTLFFVYNYVLAEFYSASPYRHSSCLKLHPTLDIMSGRLCRCCL